MYPERMAHIVCLPFQPKFHLYPDPINDPCPMSYGSPYDADVSCRRVVNVALLLCKLLLRRFSCAGACREPFPLLADPVQYTPDTLDTWGNRSEMDYWLGVLLDQIGTVVEKAAACDGQPGGCHLHELPPLRTTDAL